ncbi:MAG: glyoxylate/hydroxypyruvate reductase A [Proteobacteria bacterium]|nr:glyoxylate/hydroxypyruvate reductase A [Pseudomonadota bacterium]
MAILVAARFDADDWARWWPALDAAFPDEVLIRDRRDADPDDIDIALLASPPPGALRGLPRLRFLQSLWAGVDSLLADPDLPAELPLARLVDPAMSDAMAETALWATFGLQRGFFDCLRRQRGAVWQQPDQPRPDEIHVVLLGLGEMGRCVARRLLGQGFRVTGWSSGRTPTTGNDAAIPHCAGPDALDALLPTAQIVINLLPLTPATHGLIDARFLARLPRGAGLVNLARGAHVVDADLLAALDRGDLAHAVLDVYTTEPLPAAHPYWQHPRVSVLPHTAAQTDPRSAAPIAAANVRRWRAGQPVQALVDRARGY